MCSESLRQRASGLTRILNFYHAFVSSMIKFTRLNNRKCGREQYEFVLRSSYCTCREYLDHRNVFIWRPPQSFFHLVFRVTVRASCPMDLRLFPFDQQHCNLNIESCKYVFSFTSKVLEHLFDFKIPASFPKNYFQSIFSTSYKKRSNVSCQMCLS